MYPKLPWKPLRFSFFWLFSAWSWGICGCFNSHYAIFHRCNENSGEMNFHMSYPLWTVHRKALPSIEITIEFQQYNKYFLVNGFQRIFGRLSTFKPSNAIGRISGNKNASHISSCRQILLLSRSIDVYFFREYFLVRDIPIYPPESIELVSIIQY